ncbi:hypothetical protein ES707_13047 [subsurface metagenome]
MVDALRFFDFFFFFLLDLASSNSVSGNILLNTFLNLTFFSWDIVKIILCNLNIESGCLASFKSHKVFLFIWSFSANILLLIDPPFLVSCFRFSKNTSKLRCFPPKFN